MHPQLNEEKRRRCGALIAALEECHQESYMKRMFGICNNVKEELNECLSTQRLKLSREKTILAREKRKTIEARWKQMEEEEYGPGGKLKEVVGR
ncbi:COX assembly mitochondrial protein 2 [Trichomonascus vanleenenianus]|uniref:Cmc2p n=1 Tax=Trichomonascus vanleenenianus TaxID=2268995 RepID=UPI003ECB2F8A